MKKNQTTIQVLVLLSLSWSLLGNQSCNQQTPTPPSTGLKRRVQLGKLSAPHIQLPQQAGTFDFAYVANGQMYNVLRETNAFSTAAVDPLQLFDPNGLNEDEKSVFQQCGVEEDAVSSKSGLYKQKTTLSQDASCMIPIPQGIIKGQIYDFTLTSQIGASLSLGQVAFLPGAQFNIKNYELSIGLRVTRPLARDEQPITTIEKQSFQNQFEGEAVLNFGQFQIGPKGYYATPLRKVVDQGLTQAIAQLREQWDKIEPWYATVLRSCDKYIYINAGGGSDAGLQTGDILKVYNIKYLWEGQACHSYLSGTIPASETPIVYVKVTTVGDNIAAAEIIENNPQYPHQPNKIMPGARVYLEKTAASIKEASTEKK